MFVFLYLILLSFLTLFSYGFIDTNFPYQPPQILHDFAFGHKGASTVIYSTIIVLLFIFYACFLFRIKNKKSGSQSIWKLIAAAIAILFFSFPAFSNDILNYIATAKITYLYRENPYIVMPIEIPNEPMLFFLHAANKTALYGFSWILLTAIPHFFGFGNLLVTMFAFKAFIIAFYLGLAYLIWRISKKNTFSLAFFALNPLVVIETLVSSHNDVVMMFFALLSYYYLKKRKMLYSIIFLLVSIFIKYAAIFLLPVYIYALFSQLKHKRVNWNKIFFYSAVFMYLVFFLSPVREEMYSWYFIWPLSFVALLIEKPSYKKPSFKKIPQSLAFKTSSVLRAVSLGFSFGLLFRFAPFIYTRNWGGVTPTIKILATWIPSLLVGLYILAKKYVSKK